MVLTNNQNTSDFFLPHQELNPVERFLKSIPESDNQFSIPSNLPDLAFLRRLSIQGRLFQESGSRSVASIGDVITLTPTSGETLFIYALDLKSSGVSSWTIINSNVTRVTVFTLGGGGVADTFTAPYFDSIVGDGTKTFIVQVNATAGTRTAVLLGWKENTSRIRDVSE